MERAYEWYVGIDWATEIHEVCLLDQERRILERRKVEHRGEALRGFFRQLMKLAEDRPERVAVAIETPRGSLVESLIEQGFHVYALNPKQLDRFRDRHNVAGAKDDPLDSFVLAASLSTDMPCFRRVRTDDPMVVQIRELSRASDELKNELGRLSNQLREQVHRLLPQLLELSPGADEPWLWDVMALVCKFEPGRIRPAQLRIVLKERRIRRFDADTVLGKLREEAPWTTPGTREAVRAHIMLLLPRLQVTRDQTRDCERQIERLLEALANKPATEEEIREHRDVRILQSLPGAGKVVVATMLAEASQPLADRDYNVLRAQGGISPVTKSSGKRSKARATVTMRYACNMRLRRAMFWWAQEATKQDEQAKQHYAALRKRGHSHGRALRGVADRLLRILTAMLKTRTVYDPAHPCHRQPETASKPA